ncbi:MAG TPA: metallophosphatase domain-containing protein [Salinimicrobium sp.]|nr:metallophosphatase domain-containing protein [Salinimicrobium sp.]
MVSFQYKDKSIAALSDTHGRHRELQIPETDILVHCGDACNNGDLEELFDFFEWFSKTPATHRIFVAGNHDLPFDLEPDLALNLIPHNVVYLENRCERIAGIDFLSLPARPWLHFLPEKDFGEIDVLLTHCPAHSGQDNDPGCPLLKNFINHAQPKYHLFGHLHEFGQRRWEEKGTVFLNICTIFKKK